MFEERWLSVDAGKRSLRVGLRLGAPSGPVLVMLHGVTRMWRDWEPMVPFLSHDWTIYAIDHRGHGQSDRAQGYLVSDYAEDLIDLLQQGSLGESVVLLGHSLGGMVAAIAASEVPELVRAAVLEDPPWDTMGQAIIGTAWQTLFQGMRQVCIEGGSIETMSAALGSIRVKQADGTEVELRQLRTEEALRWGANCLSKLDPRVLDPLIAGRWLEGIDWPKVAERIECPTVLLQADFGAGGALSDQDAKSFSQGCKNCERIPFPGKNHQLHGTIPGEIARIVDRFAD
ncbi:MAG: alpha/beta fold hydrolase [Planctomycetota bacterium]|jgi:pimeloyl-ACP methyl ester carboxylesterase